MSDEKHSNQGHLVPIGTRELTTRSSALVRRGLESLISQQVRLIRFPSDRSMGTLHLWDKNATWQSKYIKRELSEACGTVAIPFEKQVALHVSEDAARDLSPLGALEPGDLQDLFLPGQVDDAALLHVQELTGLEGLSLQGIQISDTGLVYVQKLTNLKSLGFRGTQITDAGLVHLRGLTELQLLNLFGTRINGAGLIYLWGLTKLKSLFFWGAQISDAGLENIQGLTSLKSLRLEAPQVTDAGLAH